MTNIPKKLEPTLETGMVDLGNKINEIIDCLESKQTTHVCNCCKKDVSKIDNI